MHFRDRRGREWCLGLTIVDAQRLRRDLGLDLMDPGGAWMAEMDDNAVALVDAMYLIAEPQCVERRIKPERFARLLRPCFPEAHAALVAALVDFFPPAPDKPKAEANDDDGDGETFGWRQLWQYAGYLGVDPRPLSLRELCWMMEGRLEFESKAIWAVGSAIIAKVHNAHFKPHVKPDDVNPWSKKNAPIDFSRPRRRPLL